MPSRELESKLMDVRAVVLQLCEKATTTNGWDYRMPMELVAQGLRHLYGMGADARLCASVGVAVAEGVILGQGWASLAKPEYQSLFLALTSEGVAMTCLTGPLRPA